MKYVVCVPDGCADEPVPELDGQTPLEAAATPVLDALAARAEGRISLAPFDLGETREFVRWMIEASGASDVGQVIDFDAVTLIHELCNGIPDSISTICIKAREVARKQKQSKVTTEQVRKAADMLHITPNVRLSDVDTVMMKALKVEPEEDQRVRGKLIVRTGGQVVQEKREITSATIVLAGEEDFKKFGKNKKPPWTPATEVQKKDFIKFSILNQKLDREAYRW